MLVLEMFAMGCEFFQLGGQLSIPDALGRVLSIDGQHGCASRCNLLVSCLQVAQQDRCPEFELGALEPRDDIALLNYLAMLDGHFIDDAISANEYVATLERQHFARSFQFEIRLTHS